MKLSIIGHPSRLDGTNIVMDAILVDSYGDTQLVKLYAGTPIGENTEGGDFFIPCAHCGNPVLMSSIMANNDRCYHCGAPEERAAHLSCTITMEERIKVARQEAEEAFWAVIVKRFPEANSGDFMMSDMDDVMLSWVKHWVDNNVPTTEPSYRGGKLADDMHLNYPDVWHLLHTGGCMVAVTDNVCVAIQHNYLAVTADCVCIYTDTFNQDAFLTDHLAVWEFGDNPTVLMNYIDELMGGTGYWDTGKFFDDIVTIAKSGKC